MLAKLLGTTSPAVSPRPNRNPATFTVRLGFSCSLRRRRRRRRRRRLSAECLQPSAAAPPPFFPPHTSRSGAIIAAKVLHVFPRAFFRFHCAGSVAAPLQRRRTQRLLYFRGLEGGGRLLKPPFLRHRKPLQSKNRPALQVWSDVRRPELDLPAAEGSRCQLHWTKSQIQPG